MQEGQANTNPHQPQLKQEAQNISNCRCDQNYQTKRQDCVDEEE